MLKSCGNYVVYLLVRLLVCLLQSLSLKQCGKLAPNVAWLATDVLRIRRRVIDDNIRHAFPGIGKAEVRQLTLGMWEHLVLMVCEIALAPRRIHQTNWRRYVNLRNIRPMVRDLLDPRPTVVLSGHYGNFEIAGYMAGLFGFPSYTVARPLDNPFLDRWLKAFRERTGQYILDKSGSAPEIDRVLKRGDTMAMLADQFAGPKGCWVEFFGRPASYHKAIAVFSLTSGAPMVVSATRRTDGPLQFEMACYDRFDPADRDDPRGGGVKQLTQWYSQQLELAVREEPRQYWWVHRRWKEAPPAKKKKQGPKLAKAA